MMEKNIHILTEIVWLAKASLIAREAAVESRRASDSVCAIYDRVIYVAYPHSPEIPAKSTTRSSRCNPVTTGLLMTL